MKSPHAPSLLRGQKLKGLGMKKAKSCTENVRKWLN
jgi:hypothetical protein